MARVLPRPGDPDSLWTLILSPIVWTAHFLFVYVFAAILCQKAPGAAPLGLGALPLTVGLATLVALGLIGWAGAVGWRRWRGETPEPGLRPFEPHDADTVDARRRFTSFASVLLAGLSGVAVLYQTLPALFLPTCV